MARRLTLKHIFVLGSMFTMVGFLIVTIKELPTKKTKNLSPNMRYNQKMVKVTNYSLHSTTEHVFKQKMLTLPSVNIALTTGRIPDYKRKILVTTRMPPRQNRHKRVRPTESPYELPDKLIFGNIKETPQNTQLCIEPNICKKHANDTFYIYSRNVDFLQRVDAPIYYNSSIKHSDYVVPNIFHFVQYTNTREKWKNNNFEFHHMVSVLSAYKIQKPDRIYFWLDQEPVGRYWKTLRATVPMYLIQREAPSSIRGRKVSFITKISNVIRMEAIIEYGGIYIDLDVIVVKSFNPLRKIDASMGNQERGKFCNAVLVGSPWAGFFRLWHQKHDTLVEILWDHHSGKIPFLLSEEHPTLINVEETSFFRPSFRDTKHLFYEGKLYDWQNGHYCVHLWIRMLREKPVDDEIDTLNTTMGQLYRYILYGDYRLRPL